MDHEPNPARDLIEALGRRDIARALNVTPQAVTNWIRRRRIPAEHFFALRALCRRRRVPISEEAFVPDTSEAA